MKPMKRFNHWLSIVSLTFLVGLYSPALAQWQTQSFDLRSGWNAIYLNVDASYLNLDDLIGTDVNNPIQEVWHWKGTPSGQFVRNPSQPAGGNSQWESWDRSLGPSSLFHRLIGNGAYLVHSTGDYTWNIKGQPVPPQTIWTAGGLNFLGFSTPTNNPPTFDSFFSAVPTFLANAQIFNYPGGPLGNDNPSALYAVTTYPLKRGEAYWIRTGDFNSYFGPFALSLTSGSGIAFSDFLSQFSFRIRNNTPEAVSVNLTLLPSEPAPEGAKPVVATPPLLLRGELNRTNLTYGFTTLDVRQSVVLQPQGSPGSDIEVVLGLNRSALTSAPGSLMAGILRLTDGSSLSQIDLPVSATVASNYGLWVGNASVSAVNQYLTSYYTVATDSDLDALLVSLNLVNGAGGTNYLRDPNSGRIIVLTPRSGSFLKRGTRTDTGSVAHPFDLRLIVHSGTNGTSLLQRVFVGRDVSSNQIVAIQDSFLDPAHLVDAHRISAGHLPWTSANLPWAFDGALGRNQRITTTVTTGYNDHTSTPFLHTYHPDHDNLDAQFATVLDRGFESYDIQRTVTLQVNANPTSGDFNSVTRYGSTLTGAYSETIVLGGKGTQSRTFDSSGTFVLNRIMDTPSLVIHP